MHGDILIINGLIIPKPGKSDDTLDPGFILIRGENLAKIGPMSQAGTITADKLIDASGCLVMPGLINMHGHSAMTLFRGMADDLELSTWLNEHIFPAEAKEVTPEMVYWCSRLAAAEMIFSGTTTVADGYFYEHEAARAFHDCGLRAVAAQGVIDFPAPGVPNPTDNMRVVLDFIDTWQERSPLITPAVFAHSPYTCSPETLIKAKKTADDCGILFYIHLAETENEAAMIITPAADTPVRHLHELGILDENTICVHCVWVDDRDLEILAESGAGVVTCPQSNMKLASGSAPVQKMQDHHLRIGIGTDSCASNNTLDLFREMDITAKLAKIRDCDPTAIMAPEVLQMATKGGAQLLGKSSRLGTLSPGYLADLILVDLQRPHLSPFYNHSLLVYSGRGSDVKTVIINGRVVMEDRLLKSITIEETMEKVYRLSES